MSLQSLWSRCWPRAHCSSMAVLYLGVLHRDAIMPDGRHLSPSTAARRGREGGGGRGKNGCGHSLWRKQKEQAYNGCCTATLTDWVIPSLPCCALMQFLITLMTSARCRTNKNVAIRHLSLHSSILLVCHGLKTPNLTMYDVSKSSLPLF